MTKFAKIQQEASASMIERAAMLAQPCESFRHFFGGRVPSVPEKMFFVEEAIQRKLATHIFQNDLYRVDVTISASLIYMEIRRRDAQRFAEWHDLQQIKNELIGPEYEAVQLFPAESRRMDTESVYYLSVYAEPHVRFQFGFANRFVLGKDETLSNGGSKESASQ